MSLLQLTQTPEPPTPLGNTEPDPTSNTAPDSTVDHVSDPNLNPSPERVPIVHPFTTTLHRRTTTTYSTTDNH